MVAAIFYARCSTEEQHLSTDAQRAAADRWALTNGVQIVSAYVDRGVSGASELDAREGLAGAFLALKEHAASILLVARLDRVARDVGVFAAIERAVAKLGARIACADGSGNGDGPADGFMRHVLSAAAAYELALLRARTKAALGVKRARGERVGSVRYGFALADDGVRLVEHVGEQRTIATARALHALGMSLRDVAASLEARGMVARSGRRFGPQQVAEMVKGSHAVVAHAA